MTSLRAPLLSLARRYQREDQGTWSVEAVIMAPLIMFSLVFCYTFFTAFQAKSEANKANYTISDYLSRQTDPVTPAFLNGTADLYRFLNNSGDIDMRVSEVKFSLDSNGNGSYSLVWSYAVGNFSPLTTNSLSDVENRLPLLANGEEVLLVETVRTWSPLFDVGLAELTFADTVTTKPRFATQVLFDDGSTSSGSSNTDTTDDPNMDQGSGGRTYNRYY
ncbi:MAG: hypothetical protein KJ731_16335 [Alphaproteobacteria bacterium]|nr:hypothetical protein [Alphaproteobacteria bacterium]MBU1572290.1 hypothetical protein [Alphaproteobacteria bacterium]MBU1830017.1 hypothetical protein [Alphaproteobacteria bacterium]MBU2080029.1 hypothetical protein [Alphaproteobacteria bacterium]MBU2162804.1 hypothetical protein [Alphaproteobacteria bacterium]